MALDTKIKVAMGKISAVTPNNGKNKVIIVGKAGCGKNYVCEIFKQAGVLMANSMTTRPKRSYDESPEYTHLNRDVFEHLIKTNKFLQYTEFNGHYYGTLKSEVKNSTLFIMTPSGISQLNKKFRSECLVIYVMSQSDVIRLQNRGGSTHENQKRMESDELEFKDFKDYDMILINQ